MQYVELLGYSATVGSWLAMYLAGKKRAGWMVSFLLVFLWGPYAIKINSIPVLLNTCVWSAIALRNWFVWEDKEQE